MSKTWLWTRIIVYARGDGFSHDGPKRELGIYGVRPGQLYSQILRKISIDRGYHIDKLSYKIIGE